MVIAVHSIEGRSVAGPYNDAFSDAFDGEVGTTPPPSMPIEWPHAPSWWQNPERPVGLLLDPTGHAVAELPVVSASPKVEVSAVGECSLTLNLLPDPTLDSLLRVWEGSVVFTLGGKPFFGGYVARRRSSLGRTVLEVQVREWSGWLGRVWSNSDLAADEYDGDPINIGTLAWNRLQTAVKIIPPGIKFPPPLAGITHVNDATLSTVDELLFHNQDLPEANSPQSFLDEFDQMKEIGLDWTFPWEKRQDGTMWPTFRTANYVDDAPLAGRWTATTARRRPRRVLRISLRASSRPSGSRGPPWNLWNCRRYAPTSVPAMK